VFEFVPSSRIFCLIISPLVIDKPYFVQEGKGKELKHSWKQGLVNKCHIINCFCLLKWLMSCAFCFSYWEHMSVVPSFVWSVVVFQLLCFLHPSHILICSVVTFLQATEWVFYQVYKIWVFSNETVHSHFTIKQQRSSYHLVTFVWNVWTFKPM